jgi:hypothetical protein
MRNRHQLALPIGKVEVPEHLLRAAYERSRLQIGFVLNAWLWRG